MLAVAHRQSRRFPLDTSENAKRLIGYCVLLIMFSVSQIKRDLVPESETLVQRLWCCCIGLHNIVLSTPSTARTVPNNKYTNAVTAINYNLKTIKAAQQQIEISSRGQITNWAKRGGGF